MPTAWVQGSPLTAEVYELIDYPAKVSFNYDVDIIVPFLDHLPTSIFYALNVDKNMHFWTTYPPHLVHVVIERPLRDLLWN